MKLKSCSVFVLASLCLMLTGCAAVTTPTGQVGRTVRFRHFLPEEVLLRSPTYGDGEKFQTVVRVGDSKARVAIIWEAFRDNLDAYILSASFEVINSVPGLEVNADLGQPRTIDGEVGTVQAIPILIRWVKRLTFSGVEYGTQGGTIFGDGTWQPD